MQIDTDRVLKELGLLYIQNRVLEETVVGLQAALEEQTAEPGARTDDPGPATTEPTTKGGRT
jgi:hypothetical protein